MRKAIQAIYLRVILLFFWGTLCSASTNDIKVGTYYYPWYGPTTGGHAFTETLRDHLVPKQYPELGYYNSADAAVIEAHINHSVEANIQFWVCSWWGPGGYDDNIIKNHILAHPQAGKLKYAIFYESPGRLGYSSDPDYTNLMPDFHYLAENYFSHPHYLRIDDRPVVFIYLSRLYFRTTGDEELAELRATYPYLYIVGDEIYDWHYNSNNAAKWDAVTAHDMYTRLLGVYGATHQALERLEELLDDGKTAANKVGVGLIPFCAPGYNDRGVREGHTGVPRYFEDDPLSKEGDFFRSMLRDVVVPKVDPLAEKMLMVVTFNEWHEDTQIEPTMGTAGTTDEDDSDTGDYYTEGDYYTDYGHLYLEILRQETRCFECNIDFNHDCIVNFKDYSILAEQWLQPPGLPSADIWPPITGDGIVDSNDLYILINAWLASPPSQASGPVPFNGASYIDTNEDLSWSAASGVTSYDVYFGTSSPGEFRGNQVSNEYDPGTLEIAETYYWRIDTVNGYGKTTGEVWSFMTFLPPP